jgi:hypothetical protein
MCLIHTDYKHYCGFETKEFQQRRNDSSIM